MAKDIYSQCEYPEVVFDIILNNVNKTKIEFTTEDLDDFVESGFPKYDTHVLAVWLSKQQKKEMLNGYYKN
jgi:hypothetical protein